MTLIEGIGDEVTQFFGLVVLLVFGLIAWWSTGISELPPMRTVFIFERRTQRDVGTQQQVLISQQPERNDTSPNRNFPTDNLPFQQTNNDDKNPSQVSPEEVTTEEVGEVVASDDNCQSRQVNSEDQDDVQSSDNHSNERQEPVSPDITDTPECQTNSSREAGQNVDNIRIRLKYLNDDQKLVNGKLNEVLGDFKRRHFSLELSREKRIRLIFNGQVLQSDDQTLQGYGLYDNCVVHCLVHAQQNTSRPSSQQATHINASPPEWNLGGVLYICLSIIIGFAWLFRYQYAQLFSLTTTTALTGLTAMFAVSIIGMYMPDQEAAPA